MELSRSFQPAEITPKSRHRRSAHDHRRQRPSDRPESAASAPALRAADQGVADALESVLSDNTQRVYAAQWRIFRKLVRLGGPPIPAGGAPHRRPLPGGARQWRRRIATLRLATSAIAKVHEWAGHESPGRDRGVREAPEGLGPASGQTPAPGRRPHRRRVGCHPPHRSETPGPRPRPRNARAGRPAGERLDVALVAVLSDGGLRRSEAAALTWGDVQRWDDGSGRITVIRSKTDAEAQGAVVAITPAAVQSLDAIRPVGVTSGEKVFGLSESQIARRVKVIAKAAGLADWEFFSGHSGRVGMAPRPGGFSLELGPGLGQRVYHEPNVVHQIRISYLVLGKRFEQQLGKLPNGLPSFLCPGRIGFSVFYQRGSFLDHVSTT